MQIKAKFPVTVINSDADLFGFAMKLFPGPVCKFGADTFGKDKLSTYVPTRFGRGGAMPCEATGAFLEEEYIQSADSLDPERVTVYSNAPIPAVPHATPIVVQPQSTFTTATRNVPFMPAAKEIDSNSCEPVVTSGVDLNPNQKCTTVSLFALC